VPPGVELAVAAAEPKDMRALVRLANYSFFAPIPPPDGERGWLLPLESMSTSPYGEYLAGDPMHPNALGHELLASALAPLVLARHKR